MSKMSHSSSLKSHKLLFSTEKAGSSSFTEKSGLSKVCCVICCCEMNFSIYSLITVEENVRM